MICGSLRSISIGSAFKTDGIAVFGDTSLSISRSAGPTLSAPIGDPVLGKLVVPNTWLENRPFQFWQSLDGVGKSLL
jgi:hypothetical protein